MDAFDYVVIGAGSAGCVVARRLSEDGDATVLLLEAGPPATGFWNRTPAGMAKLHRSPRYNWNYVTEPEPCLGQRSVYWPSGKALGGGSAINGMVYVRGDRRDYDGWARLGNPGWSWQDVLPYFIRSEANARGASALHGADGPMAVSEPSYVHPTVHDFLAAARRTGLPQHDDFSDGEMSGAGIVQCTIRDGIRESSYDAFVKPVATRPNLEVATDVHVCRVLVQDRVAVGVEFFRDGRRRKVYARREVILCAGAIGSPHLLLLSGIGDADDLQQQGIPVMAHLPGVGKNLQDHFAVRVQAQTTDESSYNRILRGWRKYREGARYLVQKRGFLALATSSAAAFVKSDPTQDYADLELSFRPMTFTMQPTGEFAIDPYSAISTSVYRVRPSSRGQIALRTANPLDPPAIIANYLSAPDDVAATIAGVRLVRRIFAAEPLAARVRKELIPGADAESDAAIRDYLVRTGGSVFHPAGSCRMGRDAMAVVDSDLRVRGVGRLRVIDASIMPTVVTGNTNAAAIMIGEKGADLVRGAATLRRDGAPVPAASVTP